MHIWPFLFSAQQSFSGSEIGDFGHCRVRVEAEASPAQSGRLSVTVAGKRVWSESCDPSEVKVFKGMARRGCRVADRYLRSIRRLRGSRDRREIAVLPMGTEA
jgi:hypothetical protein